ncbi:MAG: tetratricopeptide (TPR) repeat protein [Phenylobacterium sp.]|jgi:tetratricopeptide (TPR) repeat protein
MDSEQRLLDVMSLEPSEHVAALQQWQDDGVFDDGNYKKLLLFFIDKKREFEEVSTEAATQVDNVINAMMLFQAFYLKVADMQELLTNSNIDTGKHNNDSTNRIHELNDMTAQAVDLKYQASRERSTEKLQASLDMHLNIIDELQHLDMPDLLARNYYQAALVYKRQEKYSQCVDFIERAISINEALGIEETIMSYRIALAQVYVQIKNHKDAYDLYLTLKNYYETMPPDDSLIFIYDGLAELHWIRNEREYYLDIVQGMNYLFKAVLNQALPMYPGLERNLCSTFDLFKEFRCYQQALDECLAEFNTNRDTLNQRLQGYSI